VEGSQAKEAGLQRGDILCVAGSDGKSEIMYDDFLAMAKSRKRPVVFGVRRIQTKAATAASVGNNSCNTKSADAYARKQAGRSSR